MSPGPEEVWKVITDIQVCLARVKTDTEWLKRAFWVAATVLVGIFITLVADKWR